ncbi:hypothetical protein, partial [Rudaea sp.]|uniref:hypothetical protein n=1 Tax=Rudaea sp. TaxID=2136325 RepID=UPI002ECFC3A4
MTQSTSTNRLRLCVFGTQAADADWLARVRAEAAGADVTLDDASNDANAALRAAARAWPGDDLILLYANTSLPPHWFARLTHALAADDVLVASPLDNLDAARSPLATGGRS